MSKLNALGFKDETQSRFELDQLLDFLVEHNVTVWCEIGVYAGTTFLEVYKTLREANPDARLTMIGVDYPDNPAAFNHLTTVVIPEIKADPNVDVHLIVGNSTAPDTVERVKDIFFEANPSSSMSFIFIDGDHSYRQSKDDYQAYKHMFDFVGFNDCAAATVTKNQAKHGYDVATVYHLFDALTLDMPRDSYVEFFDANSRNPRGIGIIGIP